MRCLHAELILAASQDGTPPAIARRQWLARCPAPNHLDKELVGRELRLAGNRMVIDHENLVSKLAWPDQLQALATAGALENPRCPHFEAAHSRSAEPKFSGFELSWQRAPISRSSAKLAPVTTIALRATSR